MKAQKLTKTAKTFLTYGFKGDNKYHTLVMGSGWSNKNSMYTAFAKLNAECIDIQETGNDAPRGGQLGNYEIVHFNENFYEKYGWFLEELENERECEIARQTAKVEEEAEMIEIFKKYVEDHPEKIAIWEESFKELNNKKIRMRKTRIVNQVTKTCYWGNYRIFEQVIG